MTMKKLLQQFVHDERGATAIEYGLIAAVLSLAIVGGVGRAANAIQWLFSDTNSQLVNAFAQH
ncbi:Flp family type IVb pilin [Mesorhizobium sp. M4B.F.Ca.ET.215.01.1.1]|uniref:Flp family type IVb pilin n=1 Tax=Mesorhizobium abyssinicae TaxID=1209958 RepID=A0ABU5AL71_9HYPH|nr:MULTISPECIES: Flp family type IVb pilin [Mesorhizobium]MDX8435312.1 Flp family type IVb pilin [Mesorhizobium abyssinicae]MDX8538047.1 Flp family type IVb pilin [Mesorhizobium abyssinicae]RUW23518.1 Flp family type IVb pilin [Mesorhizobium sp. M4B.F.Ca.ET.013.02.1.1]RUW77443.1 Flp family type IVb pilin [Mesorhizobium sp. M4B.F.Ca.ET.049.02.1.2]RVD37312.1 Flp family type IVb pilin [Mesorhizobium sp. M4B.F.Ca.ET.019.03.1.1]